MPIPLNATTERDERLEALRLFAALLVVLCHVAAMYASQYLALDVDASTLHTTQTPVSGLLIALYYQFHGAYLFFAISGYVITRAWFDRQTFPRQLEFLSRRARRLLPAACCAILASALFDFYALQWKPLDVAQLAQNLTYLNWLIPDARPPVLIVTWTLAVEWLFYLVIIPLAARLVFKPPWWTLFLALVVALALRQVSANAYAYPLYFALGVILSQRASARATLNAAPTQTATLAIARLIGGLVLITAASLTYAHLSPVQWRPVQMAWRPFDTFVLLHLAGTGLLLQWASASGPRIPRTPGIAPISRLTYSIYLWHLPAALLSFALLARLSTVQNMPDLWRLPLAITTCLLATLAFAQVSFSLLEQPYFRWRRRQAMQPDP